MTSKKVVLPIIVLSQFCCTSLWFVGNAIIGDLAINFNLNPSALGDLTAAIQFGFIIGTFIFAMFTIADWFSPSKVFFVSAIVASLFNVLIVYGSQTLLSLIILRFLTGFFLAGIYPVGMKIASDYFEKGLGKSLSFLVGALVLGTAFPHILKGAPGLFFWKHLLYFTSVLAVLGGILIVLFVPDGPFKKTLQKFDVAICYNVFKIKKFRNTAFGYFGHMWELYAFWAFIPFAMYSYAKINQITLPVSVLSAVAIAIGGISCIVGGYLSQRYSSKKVAYFSLWISGLCCLLSPFIFFLPTWIFMLFFGIWGMAVTADSPQFSSMVASTVSSEMKGTALVLVNCIGFAISIFSIELLSYLTTVIPAYFVFLVLALGPIFGLLQFRKMQTN